MGVSGVSADTSGTRAADFDHKAACFTFDDLEKVIVQAVAEDELDVAAEYVDTLFILADQLDEFHEEYRSESEHLANRDTEIEHEEASLQEAIVEGQCWALEHEHPVAEWFQGGERA